MTVTALYNVLGTYDNLLKHAPMLAHIHVKALSARFRIDPALFL